MKKILTSSIAALAFACTLTGCGNNSGKTSVSENPPTVILNLEYQDSLRRAHGQVYLCISAVLFADVEVVIDCTLVNATLIQKLGNKVPL